MAYDHKPFRFTLTPITIALSILVGVIAGLGALAFYFLLQLMTDLFLGFAGYTPPPPSGELTLIDLEVELTIEYLQGLLLILLPGFGGLISGILTYKLAPETEGHGTDMVIGVFHWKRGVLRKRVAPVKAVASAVLIGTGGSAGREGPIAQIGACFASVISTKLGLSERERELLVIAGMSAGIGSIFRSPFGGSIFGIEVLYKRDYEVQALVPAVIATFTAYVIFSAFVGWQPIFDAPEYSFTPHELPFFAGLGIISGIMAKVYVRTFYLIRDWFRKLRVPNYIKPAIGGLMTGLVGFFVPQALHTGYGWLQLAMWGKIALELMLIIIIAKVLATSFSVGSGGSGGVFAPSVVIGGFLGGAFGTLLSYALPNAGLDPGVFVIIGMGCFFAAAAKVPLASIIMVAEMTGDYNLLAPAFLASIVAYLISGDTSIYETQVEMQFRSPFHEREVVTGLLSNMKVKSITLPDVVSVDENIKLNDLKVIFENNYKLAIPVKSRDDRYIGIATVDKLLSIPPEKWSSKVAKDIIKCEFIFVDPNDSLLEALYKMLKYELPEIPVVERRTMKLVGTVSFRDVLKYFQIKADGFFKEVKRDFSLF